MCALSPNPRNGPKDWTSVHDKVLCKACYLRFQDSETLERKVPPKVPKEEEKCTYEKCLKETRSWLDSNPGTPSCSGSEPLPLAPILQEGHGTPEINGNFSGGCTWKERRDPEWVRVKTIVDSGASMSIAPPSMAKGVPIRPSDMSSQGRSYTSADGGRIENKGQQVLHITTDEVKQGLTCYQIGEVHRPLMAVSQTCDAGNHVLFTSDGGWIYSLVDGSTTPFQRNENIYELGMLLHVDDANGKPKESSFTRPGL